MRRVCAVNLLVCTVVKPFAAVYVAYSHATVSIRYLVQIYLAELKCYL